MLQINKYTKDDFTVLLQRNERKYPLEVEIPVVLCLVKLLRLLKIDVNKFIFMNSELFSHKWEKKEENKIVAIINYSSPAFCIIMVGLWPCHKGIEW